MEDWAYIDKQQRLDVQIGSTPPKTKYFYIWRCHYCGALEVTTRLESPQNACKCRFSNIKQYRKKPVVVEAMQLNNINAPSAVRWVGEDKARMNLESDAAYQVGKAPPVFSVIIKTLEGEMKAMPGDYIIKGVNGEFYPCKPDIFAKTYEETYEETDE